jgi:CheY-like chemotaxis protein
MLRKEGYTVIEAEDGLKGLLQARTRFPDLIIMDLALPEMDGIETARRIHETPQLSRVPIFAVSGFLTKQVESDVRAAGCTEAFSKPYDFDALFESINQALGIR